MLTVLCCAIYGFSNQNAILNVFLQTIKMLNEWNFYQQSGFGTDSHKGQKQMLCDGITRRCLNLSNKSNAGST